MHFVNPWRCFDFTTTVGVGWDGVRQMRTSGQLAGPGLVLWILSTVLDTVQLLTDLLEMCGGILFFSDH